MANEPEPIKLAEYGMQVNVEHVQEVIDLVRDDQNVFSMEAFSLTADSLDESLSDEVVTAAQKAFDSGRFTPECGTPACIAGWTMFAKATKEGTTITSPGWYCAPASASEYLGIPHIHTGKKVNPVSILFMTSVSGDAMVGQEEITREMAIYQLEQMRDHNIIWHWEDVVQRFKDLGHG